jgi:hypothetical protein
MIHWCRAKTACQKTAPALSPRWGRFFGPPPRKRIPLWSDVLCLGIVHLAGPYLCPVSRRQEHCEMPATILGGLPSTSIANTESESRSVTFFRLRQNGPGPLGITVAQTDDPSAGGELGPRRLYGSACRGDRAGDDHPAWSCGRRRWSCSTAVAFLRDW